MKKSIIILTVAILMIFSISVSAAPSAFDMSEFERLKDEFDAAAKSYEGQKSDILDKYQEMEKNFQTAKENIEKATQQESETESTPTTTGKTSAKNGTEDEPGALRVSFANLDACLKNIEEQTGKSIISPEIVGFMTEITKEELTYDIKNLETVLDSTVFLLVSPLIIAVVALLKSKKSYTKQKAISRFNGKKSFFDFGDTSYSLKNGFDGFDFSNQQFMMDEMNRQQMEWAMEECRKAGTPFDQGGYMQGYGFNPSDTMAADMQHQMDSMNNMNNMGGMF